MTTNGPTGRILHLQRLSTEDGPGIRTTVFFKGCPLRCAWCHNPESISSHPQVQWLENRCIDCHTCLDACANGCLTMTPSGITIDWETCEGCGDCVEACPGAALELLGSTVSIDELVNEVAKDRTFYDTSGGGVTASGGEPLAQPEFVAAFLAHLQQAGISTALDTCGLASRRSLEKVLPHVDLLMFDLKEIDPIKHQEYTGQRNEAIIDTLLAARDLLPPSSRLWIRTPLIPGATHTRENLRGLGDLIAEHLDGRVERWELCAFNNLCRDKYRRLGLEWAYAETPLLAEQDLRQAEGWARESRVNPAIVIATGATRPE